MIVTLYIFTHKTTKLKYFGKTVKTGRAFDNYYGSGVDWIKHLNEHGKEIEKEIFAQYEHDDPALERVALEFSEINDIVESEEWANLIPENGKGGSSNCGKLHPMFGRTHSKETKQKMSIIRTGIKLSEDTRKMMSESKSGEKHPMFGKKHSEESVKKMSKAKIGKILSEDHKKKIGESAIGRHHSHESKEKMKMQRKNLPNVICPHCGKEGHQMPMKQWHFDNCKKRGE